jgi:Flp pilus assembly protein TadB
VSKERARRRAEREARLAEEHRERERKAKAARQRAALAAAASAQTGRLASWRPRRGNRGRPRGRYERERRVRMGIAATIFVAVQIATWLYSPSWYLRFFVFGLSLLIAPVLYTLTTNRKA